VAHVDDLAAEQEVQKAQRCEEQAQMLATVAEELKREARRHLEEAHQLRGTTRGDGAAL
jgi:hypothetical protein